MSDYLEIAERFAADTAKHTMTVLHDEGLYRHLRFRAPEHSAYWFDLITWPGVLAIRGDIGESYVFQRLDDMFEFFRGKRINPHYWSEKLDGGRYSAKQYSESKFRQLVVEYFVDAVRDRIAPPGLGKAVREEILNSGDLYDEGLARQALDAFEFGTTFQASCTCGASAQFVDDVEASGWRWQHIKGAGPHLSQVERIPGFTFEDTWDWDLHDYHWCFLWACHAIVWGIAQYDTVRKAVAA